MWKRKDRECKITLENSRIDLKKIEAISNEQLMLNIIKKKGFSIEYFDEDFYICKKVRRE